MGVYIDKKMPESCTFCKLCTGDGICRQLLHGVVQAMREGRRHENCPLIEVLPHGRLIDADAFAEFVHSKWEEYDHWLLDYIEARPTIIPAEEGE